MTTFLSWLLFGYYPKPKDSVDGDVENGIELKSKYKYRLEFKDFTLKMQNILNIFGINKIYFEVDFHFYLLNV